VKGFPLVVEGFSSIPCFPPMKSLSRENMKWALNPPRTLHTRSHFVVGSGALLRSRRNAMRENFR